MQMLHEQCVNVYMDECEYKLMLKGHDTFYYLTVNHVNFIHCMIMFEFMYSVLVPPDQISYTGCLQ